MLRKNKRGVSPLIASVLLIAFVIILFVLINHWVGKPVEKVIQEKDISYEDMIKCIGKNSQLYVLSGCLACDKQENHFGENLNHLNIINCAIYREECKKREIFSVPTWIINGEKIRGFRTIVELKELTGCVLR